MKWISVKDRLPLSKDDGVLVYFSETEGIETVHIQDYFDDITNGKDDKGKQLYTKWYISQKVTHWMELPPPPKMYEPLHPDPFINKLLTDKKGK